MIDIYTRPFKELQNLTLSDFLGSGVKKLQLCFESLFFDEERLADFCSFSFRKFVDKFEACVAVSYILSVACPATGRYFFQDNIQEPMSTPDLI